jgi:DNA-directed RNA polymerase specialized sigma24 family protein
VTPDRKPRLRPIAANTIANNVSAAEGVSEAELLSRLEDALAALPPEERAAAVVAFGLGEGSTGVAVELDLDTQDAEALSRSALQLLRAALADPDGEAPESADGEFPGLASRRRHRNVRPGDNLDRR